MIQRIRAFNHNHPNITAILILLAVILLAQLLLGTRATPLDSPAELTTILTNGEPTVLEFYSNL